MSIQLGSAIEIERKFLLKRLPELKPLKILSIMQYYKDGFRYRMEQEVSANAKEIAGFAPKYYKIQKIKQGHGINQEVNITEIDCAEFYVNRQSLSEIERREISKMRHVFQINETLKAEVDVFYNVKLIMMEVELKSIDEAFEFPKAIQDVMLLEVTGNENFDNYNLGS